MKRCWLVVMLPGSVGDVIPVTPSMLLYRLSILPFRDFWPQSVVGLYFMHDMPVVRSNAPAV